jgi:hypothetical protein
VVRRGAGRATVNCTLALLKQAAIVIAKGGEDADLSMIAGYKMFLDEKVTFWKIM